MRFVFDIIVCLSMQFLGARMEFAAIPIQLAC